MEDENKKNINQNNGQNTGQNNGQNDTHNNTQNNNQNTGNNNKQSAEELEQRLFDTLNRKRRVDIVYEYLHNEGRDLVSEADLDLRDQQDRYRRLLEDRALTHEQLTEIFQRRENFIGFMDNRKARKASKRPRVRINALEEELEELKRLGEMSRKVMDDQRAPLEVRVAASEEFLENEKKVLEVEKEIGRNQRSLVESLMDFANLGKDIWKGFQDFNEPWAKADEAASKYARSVGLSKTAMEDFRKSSLDNVVRSSIAADFGVSTDELMVAQENYIKGIGRKAGVSNEAQRSLAGMKYFFGDSMNDMLVEYEKFGLSIEDTGKRMAGLYNSAVKSGVSLSKYTDNVKKGLQLAQKYTFSGGLRNMEEMAKRAAAIHMNMEQVAAFADKVNTVEGSLSTAAQLQVLGGPFSLLSDPLSMLNESINDMGALQDRLSKYTASMGVLDKQTGEVAISSFDKWRLREFAKVTGTDYNNLIETAQQQAKRGEIDAAMARTGLTSKLNETQREMLRNTATFENGEAGVVIDGSFKAFKDLNLDEKGGDLEKIRIEHKKDSDNIADIAINVRSLVTKREGEKKANDAVQAKDAEWAGTGKLEGRLLDFFSHHPWLLRGLIYSGLAARTYRGIRRHMSAGGAFGRATTPKIPKWFGKWFHGGVDTMPNFASGAKPNITITNAAGQQYVREGGVWKSVGKGGEKKVVPEKVLKAFEGKYKDVIVEQETKAAQNAAKAASRKSFGQAYKTAVARGNAKVTKAAFNTIGKPATKALYKVGAKMATPKVGSILGFGGAIIGAANDYAAETGRIKKGGALNTGLTVGSKMAEYAGMGAMLGPWGALGGALVGAVVGGVKAAKVKREVAMDNKLERMGIERKGDYGARQLKKIDKGLAKGKKISNKLRRKLEREGDFELLEQIDAAQKERETAKAAKKKERKDRRHEIKMAKASRESAISKIKSATFHVDVAHFHGKAFGGGDMFGSTPVRIKPSKREDGSSDVLRSMVDIMRRNPQKTLSNVPQQNGPIELKISGTLKLDGGNGKSVDIISEIQKNPALMRQVTQLIIKEMNSMHYGGYLSNRVFGNNMPK